MKLPVNNTRGSVVREIDVRDDVFARRQNDAVVHQVMVGQLANRRQGTAKVKTRSEVSGGGVKPRPQKGTGRARAGTIRAPHWKGGGTVFGPAPRSYRQRTPKRMKRLALVITLSSKARDGKLIVFEDLNLANAKTK
ncbi:MAG: 50S ribosomal protein L4, partial [Dehalococcoidia bacterium]